MELKDQIDKKVKEAENKVAEALQKLHNETGLIPTQINFDVLDVRTVEQYGKENAVIISNVEVLANT